MSCFINILINWYQITKTVSHYHYKVITTTVLHPDHSRLADQARPDLASGRKVDNSFWLVLLLVLPTSCLSSPPTWQSVGRKESGQVAYELTYLSPVDRQTPLKNIWKQFHSKQILHFSHWPYIVKHGPLFTTLAIEWHVFKFFQQNVLWTEHNHTLAQDHAVNLNRNQFNWGFFRNSTFICFALCNFSLF